MTDRRAYFKLDVGYLSNPKTVALVEDHPRALLLHLQCIAYAAQHLTDGKVPMRVAMRLACAEQCDLDLLLQFGLLHAADDGYVVVHDYLEHQRSAQEVNSASDKGRQAAAARWSDARSNAASMPDALPNPMPREKREKEERNMRDASRDEAKFDEFWSAYPLKKGKVAARRNWDRLITKGTDPDQIIFGARVYARSVRGVEPSKIKYPQGWLNDGRWEDEADPVEPAAKSGPIETPPPTPREALPAW